MRLCYASIALLLDTPLKSEQRCYLETIRSSGQALMGIINDVLDFSKIEAGKLKLDEADFDLHTVVEEATELVSSAAAAKKLALSFAIDQGVPLDLVGDQGRLREILLNLLSNAVRFTDQGSVSLLVMREAVAQGAPVLRFAVNDTGIGLTSTEQESLFQVFTQGLSIARRLVEMMGGSIGVSSQPGVGSTFWFTICLAAGKPGEDREDLRGRILAVAGSLPEARKRYLQRAGLTIEESEAGFDLTPDLLLVDSQDIRAPNELKKWRHWALDAGAPLLILGSREDFGTLSEATAVESIAFVPKPVRRTALLCAIESALRQRPVLHSNKDAHRFQCRGSQTGEVRIPIIALTAAVLEEERAHCYAAGMDDFLTKPVLSADFERTLTHWITR